MRKQKIDFAPRSLRRAFSETHPLSKWLGIVGLILCVVSGRDIETHLAQLDAVAEDIHSVEQQIKTRSAAAAPLSVPAIPEAQAVAVNAAIKQLNLPWRDVLEAVETGTPKTLTLLSLEPDAKRNIVKIGAEAIGTMDMIGYVQRLKLQPFLTSAFVIKHVTDIDGGDHPLQFEVEASWRGVRP